MENVCAKLSLTMGAKKVGRMCPTEYAHHVHKEAMIFIDSSITAYRSIHVLKPQFGQDMHPHPYSMLQRWPQGRLEPLSTPNPKVT